MVEPVPAASIEAPWSPEEEAALIQAAQSSPAHFKELYLRWVTPVYRYFLHQIRHPEDAEDLTSQVFLKVYEELPRYRHRGHFAAWLFTIARNKCRDYFRKTSRQVAIEDSEGTATDPDLLAQVVRRDEVKLLDHLIRALPSGELEMIRLRYVAGLSYAEIGTLLGRSEEATRKAISRLLARLQWQMGGNHE
ncbi:MAG: sigma-70 family RNA polymerase sigma factor [Anaerolineales bacterium]|jgi:RNA polymerase sigma-70 factor (ECF subfamily)